MLFVIEKVLHYGGNIYKGSPYLDDIKILGTVLRVFAIKPIIIIACVIHDDFLSFIKTFNGQQHFLQEVLYNNFTMTKLTTVNLMDTASNGALNVFRIMRYDKYDNI